MQKTAIAIPSNIAEGHELHTASFAQHVRVALASSAELDTQLELAWRLDLLEAQARDDLSAALTKTDRMLRALGTSLRRRLADTPTQPRSRKR